MGTHTTALQGLRRLGGCSPRFVADSLLERTGFEPSVPRGGAARSSVEGPVMGLERRGCVVRPWPLANRKREEPMDEAKPFKQRPNIGSEEVGSRSTLPIPTTWDERPKSVRVSDAGRVCNGLPAGGNRIRTIGPAEKETAVERGPAADHRSLARRPVLNDPIQLIGPASLVGNSREPFHTSGTDGSNPVPSSGESTNHRFLGGGAASAVCHEPAPLYARAAGNDAQGRNVTISNTGRVRNRSRVRSSSSREVGSIQCASSTTMTTG